MLESGETHLKDRMSVSPEELTINHGATFVISNRSTQIREGGARGIYFSDTRFISHYRYRFDRQSPVLLSAGRVDYYSSLAHFTNPLLIRDNGNLPPNQVRLRVARQLERGRVFEDIRVTNYALEPISLALVVEIKSDFADIFEVRGIEVPVRGTIETVWDPEALALTNTYRNGEFFAQLRYQVAPGAIRPSYANGELVFPISLAPKDSITLAVTMTMSVGEPAPRVEREPLDLRSGQLHSDHLHLRWHQLTTAISTEAPDVQRIIEGAGEDLAAVRLYLPELPQDIWMPAAGVPWFVTIFGRDSEITALQTLMLYPGFARAVLHILARYQGREHDEWRLEEPGKIMHELRFGQLAALRRIPHTPYYGTVDATPLFIILLSEVWRWTADSDLVRHYLPHARAALEWIDTYGDHDGDGFYDYWRFVPHGLKNQGWKDSGNAIVYEDGSQVPNPIAMVEFQGYVYDAKLRLAELEESFGDQQQAQALRSAAAELQERFHETFWMEDEGFFALGIGPGGRLIRSISSNPGHCLWSGIVRPELAGRVVARLLADDLSCGWGIRTLSSLNPAFNPIDYQLGAVWPHDNAIIALGCKRYGFSDAANAIARAIFDTASFFQGHRLPELYGGFQRTSHSIPVLYTAANIPQAWAAGSVFQLLQAILGLEADAPHGRLNLNPTLPDWLPGLSIKNLAIGDSRFDLEVVRRDNAAPEIRLNRRHGTISVYYNGRPLPEGS
ncbi:MAG: hypothetical protein KatS3mg057_1421 [Herpetosiphonaceae bacterium]|nr:MAG: hypothetical protein KatS3mg057_1421 [Herpetosiphonaceae bacterium]